LFFLCHKILLLKLKIIVRLTSTNLLIVPGD
jgi:hypothetical protein